MKILIKNIQNLVTNAPLAKKNKLCQMTMEDLGILENSWMTLQDGLVLDMGFMKNLPQDVHWDSVHDAGNGLVTPGWVDPHTHMVFAGDRSHEFVAKCEGKTYQEIANLGGGIKHTVSATRKATASELQEVCELRLKQSLRWGVTSLEIKSGYGLSVESEIKMLQVANDAKTPQFKSMTCLALHDTPLGVQKNSFIREMTSALLPEVQNQKLASWVDSFIEQDYFTTDEVRPFYEHAMELGFGCRVHADEFSDAGAGNFAAEIGAASADHLQFTPESSLRKMAEKNVVATVLPGTSLYSGIPYTDGKKIFDMKTPIAVASDYNPGSCKILNIAQIAFLAVRYNKIPLATVVAGLTYVAAYALRIHDKKGALAKGFEGDFVVHPHASIEEWLADCGQTQPRQVWIHGQRVV